MAIAAGEAMAETVAKTAMESTESSVKSAKASTEAAVKPPTAVKPSAAVEGSCRGRDRAASGRNCDRRRPGHPRKLVFDEPTHNYVLLNRTPEEGVSRLTGHAYKILFARSCGSRGKQNKDEFKLRNFILCFHRNSPLNQARELRPASIGN
jgi:hypothetical protein